MVVGVNEVFDNVVRYLKKNYPDVKDVSMPYCSLYTEFAEPAEKYYRAEVHFKIGGEILSKTAILKATIETGKVFWFKEGYTWQYWI